MFAGSIFLFALLARLSVSQSYATNTTSSGRVYNVEVGDDAFGFQPQTITANVGDKVAFKINGHHSVINGPYDQPCKQAAADRLVFSGYPGINGGDDGIFTYVVTSTDPMFFYCPTDNHCQKGEIFTINQSQTQTHEAYKTNAKTAPVTPAPPTTQAPSGGAAAIEHDADGEFDDDHGNMLAVGYSPGSTPGSTPATTASGTVSAGITASANGTRTGTVTTTGAGAKSSGVYAQQLTNEAPGRITRSGFQSAMLVSISAVAVAYAMM